MLRRDTGSLRHEIFRSLPRLLRPRSLLLLNDTRVIPARLHGTKPTGGVIEVLLVRRAADTLAATSEPPTGASWREDWEVLTRGLGATPVGATLSFGSSVTGVVQSRGERGVGRLGFSGPGTAGLLAWADTAGQIPLPPYIVAARGARAELPGSEPPDGAVDPTDRERYQTVYAANPGAVAAPTAGLHFTAELLQQVQDAGHEVARLTLHVGPGTFRPVTVEDPAAHPMDSESFHIPSSTAAAIQQARREGRPIVAVGTTVVRAVESAATDVGVATGAGSTQLFLRPGSTFRVVTDLVTNFHLPRSTLLMLVAAFAGRDRVMAAYSEAVQAGYRFYSYGDAMFITSGTTPA